MTTAIESAFRAGVFGRTCPPRFSTKTSATFRAYRRGVASRNETLFLACLCKNRAMVEKIKSGEALDVSQFAMNSPNDDLYRIDVLIDAADVRDKELDFCDVRRAAWIWSIGLFASGMIVAALDSRFYRPDGSPYFVEGNAFAECLWLR